MKIVLVVLGKSSSIVMDNCNRKVVHVVVGVLINSLNEVLMTRRAVSLHQGGLWEFPGGKIESNESIKAALQRELHEEIGIDIQQSKLLTTLEHHYPDKSVHLHVYQVLQYQGALVIRENQLDLRWIALSSWTADTYPLPEANFAIMRILQQG